MNSGGKISQNVTLWPTLFFLILIFGVGNTNALGAQKFNTSDRVQANADVGVRSTPAGAFLYTIGLASNGTVINGPSTNALGGTTYIWYEVHWDGGTADGWTAQDYLNLSPPITVSPGDAFLPGQTTNTLTPQFTWQSVHGATGYGFYIRDVAANTLVFPNAAGNTTTPLTGTTYSLPAGYLSVNKQYKWNLTSFSGTTEYVPPASGNNSRWFFTGVIPAAPSFTEAEGVGNYVVVAWADNSTNESGFVIERKTEANGSYSQIATVPANTTWFTNNTGLSQGVVYYYRLRAYNDIGYSVYGNETYASLPQLPNAPSGLNASSVSTGIALSWQDNSSNETGFIIERRRVSDSTTSTFTVAANQISYTDASASLNEQYCFTVRATSTSGDSSKTPESCATYTASGSSPVAKITGNFTPVTGSTVFYGNTSTGYGTLSYYWSTTAGQASTAQNPSLSFNSPGQYTITLTVIDPYNRIGTTTKTINVQAANNGITASTSIGADPVVLSTGNYIQNRTDLRLTGKGFPFEFKRFYNSKFSDQTETPLGFGWTFNYNAHLRDTTTAVLITQGDGSTWTFFPTNGGYVGELGVFDTLTTNADGVWTLTDKSQTVTRFDGVSGQLLSITDKNLNTLTCTYVGGTLSAITNSAGRVVAFTANTLGCIASMSNAFGRTIQFQYDANTNLTAVVDANGNTNTYAYDGNHQMTDATNALGIRYIHNEYNTNTFTVDSQCDAYTNWTYFAYDFTNRITWQTNAFGKVSTHFFDDRLLETNVIDEIQDQQIFTYDINRNRMFVQDKNGNQTKYAYDSRGNVTNKIDALNNVTAITYDALNNPIRRVDALNGVTRFGYDANGNLTSATNALNLVSTVQYDSSGLPIVLTDTRGFSTTNRYDAEGNLTNVVDAKGAATSFDYDGIGRKIRQIDALNRANSFAYDNNDNLLFTTNALTFVTAYTYDANDNRVSVRNPRDATVTNIFDLKDRLVATQGPLGSTNGTIYDALDRKIATFDALGNRTAFAYDDIGNLIAITNALNQVTRFTFDPNGNQTSVIDPNGHYVTNLFDALNRKVVSIDVGISTNLTAYDALGRVITATNANDQITRFNYDAIGRLTNVVDTASQNVFFSYDENGNRLRTTDPNGHTWTNLFDEVNRLIEQRNPDGTKTIFGFDPVGNITNKITPNGDSIHYGFDALNHLSQITYPSGSPVTFAYDAAGNRTNMVDCIGTTTWQYDLLDRMVSVTDPYGQTVGNGFDANGNRVSLTYPGNKTVNYGFDALNRMASLTNWQNGVVTYAYDLRGNLITATNANATTVAYGYDAANRIVGLTNAAPDGNVIAAYTLTLDGVGNHRQAIHTQPLFSILPNQTNSYTYSTDNRLLSVDSQAVSSNPNGDLTQLGTNSFSYDFEDRLTQVSLTNGTASYGYDGLGNRLTRTVNGQIGRLILDRMGALTQVLVETDANGSPTVYYVYGLGLAQAISAGGTITYHFNIQGSTVALTDAGGNLTDSYAYDSFGVLANCDGYSPQPFRYLGRYGIIDDRTGLLYARARYWSPQLGRFFTKDLLTGKDSDGQSLNRYVYALNNPTRLRDITGLSVSEGITPLKSSRWAVLEICTTDAGDLIIPPNADLEEIIREAQEHRLNLLWFYDQFESYDYHSQIAGAWNFKHLSYSPKTPQYENFGNFVYGIAGKAAGIPEQVLLRVAGHEQSNPDPTWGHSFSLSPPFGDDPKDDRWVKAGFDFFEKQHQ